MTFKELGIVEPILKALEEEGYQTPTPIQEQVIPILLKGEDLLGCAQTGTGKTASFGVPILQHLYNKGVGDEHKRKVKSLIVTPTRELALQIGESLTNYGRHTGLRNTVIFGGVKQGKQVRALHHGVDIIVATPGRLLDLIHQKYISLRDIEYFVLDEADQMLDMGFIHDIRKIIALLPKKRQSLFFSATMPPAIVTLSHKILGHPKKVTIQPEQTTAEKVEQSVYFVSKHDKTELLIHLLYGDEIKSALVFSRTKHGANKIVKKLLRADIKSEAIHGNKSQPARQKALGLFKSGEIKVLVATDIAARGIDVDSLSHVINYDLPNIAETYVHRIGRTGRAGASGVALSFCNGEERAYLRGIQKLIKKKIKIVEDHPFVDDGTEVPPAPPKKQNFSRKKKPNSNGQGSSKNQGSSNSQYRKKRRSNWKKRS